MLVLARKTGQIRRYRFNISLRCNGVPGCCSEVELPCHEIGEFYNGTDVSCSDVELLQDTIKTFCSVLC